MSFNRAPDASRGMPINKLDRRGEDLREACHSGDADKVYALISQGVEINDANKVCTSRQTSQPSKRCNGHTPIALYRCRRQTAAFVVELLAVSLINGPQQSITI